MELDLTDHSQYPPNTVPQLHDDLRAAGQPGRELPHHHGGHRLHGARAHRRVHLHLPVRLRLCGGGKACHVTHLCITLPPYTHSFAQRVAQVRNDARCNEETDPYQVIQRLKSELSTARAEVGYLRGEAGDGAPLGTAERQAVAAACEEFVARGRGRGRHGLSQQEGKGEDDAPPTLGKLTLSRVYHAFRVLRAMVLAAEAAGGVGMGSEQEAPGVGATVASASPLPAAAPQSASEGLSAARAGPPAPSLPSQSIPAARRRRSSSPAASIPMYARQKQSKGKTTHC